MTIPKECRRLAEVDFPIAEVSRHAVREKSIRHGHPSTLHLWWARRPLASSRAMLLALLLPDPGDALCPEDFRAQARAALLDLPGRPTRWDVDLETGAGLRRGLLDFIADFANWDNAANPGYLAAGRALVQAAHPDGAPLVVDPFAGGGSIPLESPAPGLRRLRQRPQSRSQPHPQNAAGGHPPAGGGAGRRTPHCRRRHQSPGRGGTGRPLSPGRGRRHPHRLPVGAHGAVRGAPLRRRNPPAALPVAVPQTQTPLGIAPRHHPGSRRPAPGGVRHLCAGRRPGSGRRHGGAGAGHLPGLLGGAAAGTGARPAGRPARRRRRQL